MTDVSRQSADKDQQDSRDCGTVAGKPQDVVTFKIDRNLQRHRAVFPAIAGLSCLRHNHQLQYVLKLLNNALRLYESLHNMTCKHNGDNNAHVVTVTERSFSSFPRLKTNNLLSQPKDYITLCGYTHEGDTMI